MDSTILDPHSPEAASISQREITQAAAAAKSRPQVVPANFFPAVPLSGASGPSSDWFVPVTVGSFGYPGGQPWQILTQRVSHEGAWLSIPYRCAAATVGEVRVLENGGGTTTSAVTLPAATGGIVEFDWLHRIPVWTIHRTFYVEARRVSGAGNVEIGYPSFALVDPQDCTTSGV